MRSALLRSGYLLEARVADILDVDQGFQVEANFAYADPVSGKQRELDMLASRSQVYHAGAGGDSAIVSIELLVECHNNPQPIAFIHRAPFADMRLGETLHYVGIPASLPYAAGDGSTHRIPTAERLLTSVSHHYASTVEATQFCGFMRKAKAPNEWMAVHTDEQFGDFVSLSDSTEYRVNQLLDESFWTRSIEVPWLRFLYPVLVVQGEMVLVETGSDPMRIRKVDHVLFRRRRVATHVSDDLHIDVVTEGGLSSLLDVIGKEEELLGEAMAGNTQVHVEHAELVGTVGTLGAVERREAFYSHGGGTKWSYLHP